MGFQKCPLCNGLGKVGNNICDVCKGAKIISEFTGCPPNTYTEIRLNQKYLYKQDRE